MRSVFDLATLSWTVAGWTPHLWRLTLDNHNVLSMTTPEFPAMPARVPGSIQQSLRDADLLPDWTIEENWRQCEWVENRHWIYETVLPDDMVSGAKQYRLVCEELDYQGYVAVNHQIIAEFCGTHLRHEFDLTPYLRPGRNVLRLIFTEPPRWLGQFGYTSQMTDWKPRFNYTWDWMVRLVQAGISGNISLEHGDGHAITDIRCHSLVDHVTHIGEVQVTGRVSASDDMVMHCTLSLCGDILADETLAAESFNTFGLTFPEIPIELWWPNGLGEQPLYELRCELRDAGGVVHDHVTRTIGFKSISWEACADAPAEADPWICVVNGVPVFLQGINWTPIRPNYADVTEEDYRHRLQLYRDLGVNIVRVWGGGRLESALFYQLCDELGLMVWQEFPMSSSGIENYPPDDEASIEKMAAIASTFIDRRHHHVSLLLWSGGNELTWREANAHDAMPPVDTTHPMIARLQQIVQRQDPHHRFVATSASGPTSNGRTEHYGLGVHWDVHGPWMVPGSLEEWQAYWLADDALLRSETGATGASSTAVIRHRAGGYPILPIHAENPLWRLPVTWWLEDRAFHNEHGRDPYSLEEYVEWSQARQATALSIAVRSCKARFPRCGGIILWMGHDSFPCPVNTSIVDFEGQPKPAALAVAAVFHQPVVLSTQA